MKKALIFSLNSANNNYLLNKLLKKNYTVCGNFKNLEKNKNYKNILNLKLTKYLEAKKILLKYQFDEIYFIGCKKNFKKINFSLKDIYADIFIVYNLIDNIKSLELKTKFFYLNFSREKFSKPKTNTQLSKLISFLLIKFFKKRFKVNSHFIITSRNNN